VFIFSSISKMSLPYEKELEERLAAMQIQLDKKKA
jgi:hypothetical protein